MTLYEKYQLEYEAKVRKNKAEYEKYNFKSGMKIWFTGEVKSYTIRSCNERYLVCTKPYNFKKNTVIYTMVDLWEGVRGRDGYVFSHKLFCGSPIVYGGEETKLNYIANV